MSEETRWIGWLIAGILLVMLLLYLRNYDGR